MINNILPVGGTYCAFFENIVRINFGVDHRHHLRIRGISYRGICRHRHHRLHGLIRQTGGRLRPQRELCMICNKSFQSGA